VARRTERELVAAVCNGDVGSFGELYCRHFAAVVGVAYCVLADQHLAEDAAQEAFVVASDKLPRLRKPDRFAAWICTIARRTAIRMSRARKETSILSDVACNPNQETHVSDVVRKAVLQLPGRAREVVVLHYFTGLSHKEIAAVLDLSTEAVHGRLVRARRMLADYLLTNGQGDWES
jgi:RNA polymerase sigma-70 factor (ECF subfamily)